MKYINKYWLFFINYKYIGTLCLIFRNFADLLVQFSFLDHVVLWFQIFNSNWWLYNFLVAAHVFLMVFFLVMPVMIRGSDNLYWLLVLSYIINVDFLLLLIFFLFTIVFYFYAVVIFILKCFI